VLLFGFLLSTITGCRRDAAAWPRGLECGAANRAWPSRSASCLACSSSRRSCAGAFYCLEALHGERRDRSLLFWNRCPVSDRTAVLAKLAVPLIVVPAVAIAVTLASSSSC
jgi:hypothetical protein